MKKKLKQKSKLNKGNFKIEKSVQIMMNNGHKIQINLLIVVFG